MTLRKTLEILIRGRQEIRLKIGKITKNGKSELIAKSIPTSTKKCSKTGRILF
jgi:hypothetical protein